MNPFLRFIFLIVIAGLVYWLIGSWALPALSLPNPFAKIAQAVLIIAVCILIIDGLLGLVGKNFLKWP